MRLEGKTALITGAGSGMGRVASVLFAKEGANVIATDIAKPGLDETAALVAEHAHGSILPIQGDVTDEAAVASWVRAGVEQYGQLNVLYNNAGIFPDADRSVVEMDEKTYGRTLDVNLKGVMLCCKHGIPEIVRAGGGSVVNIASFVALVGCTVPQDAYTASKGAVLALTKSLAVQFGRDHVRVNAICPGPILTPLLADLFPNEEEKMKRLNRIPLGRFGLPEDIVYAALYLASDESSWTTGTEFVVDGGITVNYF
ncbi:MAG: glucose 1-dehydrogenase [Dehalococcoidia bacterium]|nr:MAG: glucose 1-dehydrogenase [Dehalococcoidia bacterium]